MEAGEKPQSQEQDQSSIATLPNMEPTSGQIDDWRWDTVKRVGIGKRYLRADPDKIRVRDKILEYCENGKHLTGEGLFIVGPVGTGKTSILSYLAYRIVMASKITYPRCMEHDIGFWESSALYEMACVSATGLFNLFFSWNDPTMRSRVNQLKEMKILMIDDLGREYRSDFPVSRFEEFIEYRYANEMTTIVTSNIIPSNLSNMREFERIVDRFRESSWMKLLVVPGESMRE